MTNRRKDILKRKYIAPEMYVAELEECMQEQASAHGPDMPGGGNGNTPPEDDEDVEETAKQNLWFNNDFEDL